MKYQFTVLVTVVLIWMTSCDSKGSKSFKTKSISQTEKNINVNTILVYYFHGSIRCETCVAVDENTHQYLKKQFSNRIKKGEIIFKSINIDKEESPELIEKYKIYGQTLLFIKGEKVLDKTEDAFQYVTTNPKKWQNIIKVAVQNLIELE